MRRKKLGIIVWIVIALAFTIYSVAFWRIEPKFEENNKMPRCPRESVPEGFWEWDSKDQKWVPRYFRGDRAIVPKQHNMSERDIQEMMEKKIPGYMEDTYWGETWDLINEDED